MKVLYYYGRLNIGGAEHSSVRLVNALVRRGHQVDLLLKWQGGALEQELDPRVRVVALKKANRLTEKYAGKRWNGIPVMAPDVFAARLYQIVRSSLLKLYLSIKRPSYDLALIGYHGLDPSIVLETCCADVNAMMIRHSAAVTDHERGSSQFLHDPSRELDAYICVSQFVKQEMINNHPHLRNKAYCIYNVLPEIDGEEQREVPEAYRRHNGRLLILTLCRIDAAHKGLFRLVDACQELAKTHKNFCWIIVGDGPDKSAVQERIKKAGLEQTIFMHPKVRDPFPYYQHADLVAVLSLHEGLCGVVNEAKIMKAPLIATRFSAIDEQITHRVNGYIVENDLLSIIDGMSALLTNHDLRISLARNELPKVLLDNDAKIHRLETLVKKLTQTKRAG